MSVVFYGTQQANSFGVNMIDNTEDELRKHNCKRRIVDRVANSNASYVIEVFNDQGYFAGMLAGYDEILNALIYFCTCLMAVVITLSS